MHTLLILLFTVLLLSFVLTLVTQVFNFYKLFRLHILAERKKQESILLLFQILPRVFICARILGSSIRIFAITIKRQPAYYFIVAQNKISITLKGLDW